MEGGRKADGAVALARSSAGLFGDGPPWCLRGKRRFMYRGGAVPRCTLMRQKRTKQTRDHRFALFIGILLFHSIANLEKAYKKSNLWSLVCFVGLVPVMSPTCFLGCGHVKVDSGIDGTGFHQFQNQEFKFHFYYNK